MCNTNKQFPFPAYCMFTPCLLSSEIQTAYSWQSALYSHFQSKVYHLFTAKLIHSDTDLNSSIWDRVWQVSDTDNTFMAAEYIFQLWLGQTQQLKFITQETVRENASAFLSPYTLFLIRTSATSVKSLIILTHCLLLATVCPNRWHHYSWIQKAGSNVHMKQHTVIELYVHVTVHCNKFLFNKTNKACEFPKFHFVKKLYMFQAFPLPIIRSSILTLLGSCHQTCKKHTNVDCTVENSWWQAKEMPETCRVFWQNKIWEIRTSCWFY